MSSTHFMLLNRLDMHLQTWISPRPVINSLGLLLWAILLCLTSPVPTQAQVAEVCANGIDDDGDTLIDCDDPDCTFPLFSGQIGRAHV